MNSNTNRAIHLLLAQLNLIEHKEILVQGITSRTSSSSEMNQEEAERLLQWLRAEDDRLMKPSRGKVMHLLGLMGYTTTEGKLDYARINAFVQNIGTNNPGRKPLFKLNRTELNRVVTQVEQMHKGSIYAKKKKP